MLKYRLNLIIDNGRVCGMGGGMHTPGTKPEDIALAKELDQKFREVIQAHAKDGHHKYVEVVVDHTRDIPVER